MDYKTFVVVKMFIRIAIIATVFGAIWYFRKSKKS